MSERRNEKSMASAEDLAARLTGHGAADLTAQWMSNWSQINTRLMALAQLPLRNSTNAAEKLRQCQSPTDLMDIQLKLAREAYDEYLDETRELSQLMTKLSSDALGAFGTKRG